MLREPSAVEVLLAETYCSVVLDGFALLPRFYAVSEETFSVFFPTGSEPTRVMSDWGPDLSVCPGSKHLKTRTGTH